MATPMATALSTGPTREEDSDDDATGTCTCAAGVGVRIPSVIAGG
jgi:hypothetical protein